jgi:hypothetical protein
MSEMAYAWRPGTQIKIKAQVAGEEVSRIRDERGKMFRPGDVVAASRKASAPLHTAFEWNDKLAAAEHRDFQARKLVGAITVTSIEQPDQPAVRAFVSVRDEDGDQQFTTITHAMEDDGLRDQVLLQAERDMKAFAQKYQSFLDLSATMSAFRVAQVRAARIPVARAG